MKKGEFQKINKKFFTVIGLFTAGFVFTHISILLSENFYESRKDNLESVLRRNLNKDFDLGKFSGLRFLGFAVSDTKIVDTSDKESKIQAKSIYVRLMPIRSLINRELTFSLNPNKLKLNIKENFFLRNKIPLENNQQIKRKYNYEVHLNLKDKSKFAINNLGIQGNIKGNLIYRSQNKQLITFIDAYSKNQGKIKIKINKKFNNQLLSLYLKTKDFDLKKFKYKILNSEFNFKEGKIISNFKFFNSPEKNYCKGDILFKNINLFNTNLNENIKTESLDLNCLDNKLTIKGNKFNYGGLNSGFEIDVPLNENNISYKQEIIYGNKTLFKLNGYLPFWFNERGLNFGDLNANINFDIPRLENFNYFRNKGISGKIINGQGKFYGKLNSINTLIDFEITHPTYKGVKISETFDGKVVNNEKGYLLTLSPGASVIPTYTSIQIDKDRKLENLNVKRILYPETGTLNVVKKNKNYEWKFDQFTLKNLEISFLKINNYDRVEGEINGVGFISSDLSKFNGYISLSDGNYRNIYVKESNIKFEQNGKILNFESNLNTGDGGKINVTYNSNRDNLKNLKAKFNNVSSAWTAITVFDLLDSQNNIFKSNTGSLKNPKDKDAKKNNSKNKKDLKKFDNVEINYKEKTFNERIKSLNNFVNNKEISKKEKRLNDFLEKFSGRYDGKIILIGTNSSNYKIDAKLDGFLKEKNDLEENIKNNFSINLKGGLMENEGTLLSKFPLSIANLFFKEPKQFSGNLNLSLDYDLNYGSFSSYLSSNNFLFEDLKIDIKKSDITYKDYKLLIDSSLLIDDKGSKIDIKGQINNIGNKENKIKALNLRLDGNEKFLDLIANLSGQTFNYKDGEVDFKIKFTGSLDKPLAYGFLQINNGEIQVLKNNLKNLQTKMFFQKNVFTIDYFKALGGDLGELTLKGSIPFYKGIQLNNKEIEVNSKNLKFTRNNIDIEIDSNISVAGSIENPQIGGEIGLKNGFIDFKSNGNNNDNVSKNNKKKRDKENSNLWPEVNWEKEREIEIITNGSLSEDQIVLDLGKIIRKKTPEFFSTSNFNNLKINLGPDFRIGYANIFRAYLDNTQEKVPLLINGNPKLSSLDKNGLNADGDINITKGYANLYTTPFKLDKKPNNKVDQKSDQKQTTKQRPNSIRFLPKNGVNPRLNFYLKSKVPDSIIPISDNNMDINISEDSDSQETNNDFGTFGIGNTRFIKVEAFYDGLLNQLSFEDQNQYLKFRSTPNYSRSEIIRLISGNSANLINRIFTSQLSGSQGFNERFQLSLYPALIEDNEPINNIFSNENIDINDTNTNVEDSDNDGSSSRAWIAELGLDINDSLNFSMQATPNRDDIPPLWSLTLKANQNLEILGSFDSNGDWKSQLQLFFRY